MQGHQRAAALVSLTDIPTKNPSERHKSACKACGCKLAKHTLMFLSLFGDAQACSKHAKHANASMQACKECRCKHAKRVDASMQACKTYIHILVAHLLLPLHLPAVQFPLNSPLPCTKHLGKIQRMLHPENKSHQRLALKLRLQKESEKPLAFVAANLLPAAPAGFLLLCRGQNMQIPPCTHSHAAPKTTRDEVIFAEGPVAKQPPNF